MAEGLLEYSITGKEPVRNGNHDSLMVPHNCYKAAGDSEQWVSIAVGTEAEWRSLCQTIGQPRLANDPRFALNRTTQAQRGANRRRYHRMDPYSAIAGKSRSLAGRGCRRFPSMSNKDLTNDPHLLGRGYPSFSSSIRRWVYGIMLAFHGRCPPARASSPGSLRCSARTPRQFSPHC